MVLGGTILFIEPGAVPFFGEHVPHWAMYAFASLLWGIVIGYVVLSRVVPRFRLFGFEVELPGWRMALLQVLLATLDVAVTAAIFYALLPRAHGLDLTCASSASIVASYSAGLIANLPGGIGVFDTAMLLGLAPYLPAPRIVGAILVFRLYYYIIPLFLAGSLFAGNELLLRGAHHAARRHRADRAHAGASRISPSPPAPERSRCAASCCSRSACWSSAPIIPGSTPIMPRSRRRPASSCPR